MIEFIQKKLFEFQDLKYKEFHSKLMPTINQNLIIGVRVPVLRKFAKEVFKEYSIEDLKPFLKNLPHKYYEENNIHAFLIEQINDFDLCLFELENFLPFIDNWATCDMFCPKVFKKVAKKNPEEILLPLIKKWISSNEIYTVRFGIGILMRFFLDEKFDSSYLDLVSSINSNEYYINMMRAWFFATALTKQYEATLPIIENNILDLWTHNKTIQKAIESYRISADTKNYLRKLKK